MAGTGPARLQPTASCSACLSQSPRCGSMGQGSNRPRGLRTRDDDAPGSSPGPLPEQGPVPRPAPRADTSSAAFQRTAAGAARDQPPAHRVAEAVRTRPQTEAVAGSARGGGRRSPLTAARCVAHALVRAKPCRGRAAARRTAGESQERRLADQHLISTPPRLYTSVRASMARLPISCSGLM